MGLSKGSDRQVYLKHKIYIHSVKELIEYLVYHKYSILCTLIYCPSQRDSKSVYIESCIDSILISYHIFLLIIHINLKKAF